MLSAITTYSCFHPRFTPLIISLGCRGYQISGSLCAFNPAPGQ
ncbi:hypothetical protein GXM_05859 [Nostoc sphaeroides CCNUC1]|uniref:Uncharacterized protein n=1 Tax=Nostoc sphaeroides CCNUC1 TaxID=2653204 RepID=A0A5P8W6I2_9NOSO|nr:hypothetical protein GXM_04508 [Nostoc sphaeroides CCNUC1]QFS48367.1 hypothetical protein GXM_05859 [Nostoc sphaeroides CCNUC1]